MTSGKNMLEQVIASKENLPAPGAGQPDFGNFATSMAAKTSPNARSGGGRFNKSVAKTHLEQLMHSAAVSPPPPIANLAGAAAQCAQLLCV
jgi:hypothetical protein